MNSNGSGLLGGIVGFSLRHVGVVVALALVLVGYGAYSLQSAKYDVFPEFAPPQVAIQTEAPGLAPEQVEVLVTQPIENAINGVPGIEALRSSSIQGLSIVTVTFHPGSDIYRDRQVITERLSNLGGQLPTGVQAPGLSPLTSSTSVILSLGLTSGKRSLMELRTLADWVLKPRLLAVPGVAKVSVFGGDVRELQIQVQPDRLIKYHLGLDDVLTAGRLATGVRGAGFIDTANQRVVLQSEGQALVPARLAHTVLVHQEGGVVTLGDVARVTEAPEPPVGAAAVMGKAGVQLVISEQYGANTLDVTQNVEVAVKDLRPGLEAQGVVMQQVFRPATFIQTATGNVRFSLILGGVLVVAVLTLFLFNLRTAAISLTAIPLSLLAATVMLDYLGFSLNTMTLGGLAIAIGLLVDDAVIVVENIYRRLRENRQVVNPQPALDVVFAAALEVRSAVVYATLAIALVFIPVLTMSGVAGRLFAPLAVAYILATLASLLVALTVTPALCYGMLSKRALPERDPPVIRWSKIRYRRLLTSVESHHRVVVVAVAALTLAGLVALPFFGGAFLPELREGHFIVHMSAVPGTSLQESLRIGDLVTAELTKLPFVQTVAQRAGRAEKADDSWGTHYSEFNVDLKPLQGDAAEFVQSDVRKALAEFPGVNFSSKHSLQSAWRKRFPAIPPRSWSISTATTWTNWMRRLRKLRMPWAKWPERRRCRCNPHPARLSSSCACAKTPCSAGASSRCRYWKRCAPPSRARWSARSMTATGSSMSARSSILRCAEASPTWGSCHCAMPPGPTSASRILPPSIRVPDVTLCFTTGPGACKPSPAMWQGAMSPPLLVRPTSSSAPR